MAIASFKPQEEAYMPSSLEKLFFSFMALGPRYWHFCNLTISRTLLPKFQKIKWPYLCSWATNHKTKDTFFSSTFKV